MATYMSARNVRRRSGYRSLNAKNSSVSDMNAVIQMSMKMRRANITRRGAAARPAAAQTPGVPGPWSLVLGPWSLVLGPWSLVLGPWSLVLGPWSLVLGPCHATWARIYAQPM